MNNINLGAHFLFLLILCSIKIERLLFLKFLKILAFFDSYFWPFNKSEEKIKIIFVISAIMPPIWNVFIKFRWRDEILTDTTPSLLFHGPNERYCPPASTLRLMMANNCNCSFDHSSWHSKKGKHFQSNFHFQRILFIFLITNNFLFRIHFQMLLL